MTDRAQWNTLRRRLREWVVLVDKATDPRGRGQAEALRMVATYMDHVTRTARLDRRRARIRADRKGAGDVLSQTEARDRRGGATDSPGDESSGVQSPQ